MLLRCGVFCKQHRKTRELTSGYLKRLNRSAPQIWDHDEEYRYFGHVVRRDGGFVKQILQGAVEGKREKGPPSTSWTDDMKKTVSRRCVW